MYPKPKIPLKPSKTDKIIESLSFITLISSWILVLLNYKTLPEIIPVHFDTAGKADSFGAKWMILTLPTVGSILFIGLSILNKFPHIFNYPIEINEENAERQYILATRFIRSLKLIITILFGSIAYQTVKHAQGKIDGIGLWFLPLTIGLFFIAFIYYLVKASQVSK